MDDTWKEWKYTLKKTKNNLRKIGLKYVEILVNLDELTDYCKKNKLQINANARARFSAFKLMMMKKEVGEK